MTNWNNLKDHFDAHRAPAMVTLVDYLSYSYELAYVEAAASQNSLVLYLEGLRGLLTVDALNATTYRATLWLENHIEAESAPLTLHEVPSQALDYLRIVVALPL